MPEKELINISPTKEELTNVSNPSNNLNSSMKGNVRIKGVDRSSDRKIFNSYKQTIVFVLIILTILIVPTIFIVKQYQSTNTRQLLGSSPDHYFIWSENSAVRVESSYNPIMNLENVNQTIDLACACNEYEATQLIIRPVERDSSNTLAYD
jgi:hypothetical protein